MKARKSRHSNSCPGLGIRLNAGSTFQSR
jgi:hypothetical protein